MPDRTLYSGWVRELGYPSFAADATLTQTLGILASRLLRLFWMTDELHYSRRIGRGNLRLTARLTILVNHQGPNTSKVSMLAGYTCSQLVNILKRPIVDYLQKTKGTTSQS
jgi:hypothetical protein